MKTFQIVYHARPWDHQGSKFTRKSVDISAKDPILALIKFWDEARVEVSKIDNVYEYIK